MAGLAGEYDVVLVARSDGALAADIRPLVRVSVTVIAEQNGRREIGTRRRRRPLRLQRISPTKCSPSYVDDAVHAALVNLEARPRSGRRDDRRCSGRAGRASCCTRRSATGSKATSTARGRRRSRTHRRAGRSEGRHAWSTTARCRIAAARSTSTTKATPTQCTTLIEDGILKGYIQDSLNARLMKMPVHGQRRAANRYARAADAAHDQHLHAQRRQGPEEIIASVKKRPVCGRISAAARWTSPTASSCSRPPRRYMIENGKIDVPGQGRDADRQRSRTSLEYVTHDRQRHGSSTQASAPAARKARACRWASASRRCASTG